MTWHFRVAYKDIAMMDGSVERVYGIVEFYDDVQLEVEAQGSKTGWTDFVRPQGDSVDELRAELAEMLADSYREGEEPFDVGNQ